MQEANGTMKLRATKARKNKDVAKKKKEMPI